MRKKFKGTKGQQKILALAEISDILSKAEEVFDEKPDLADKYAKKARRVALKYKLKLPLKFKRRICKNCYGFLVPGKNLRVRTRKGHIVYYCLNCKKIMRVGYK
ncbi:MAG: ribonuclease P [Candidatus Woesearchaeota archaeon]|jgi:ribonuclease P protein subunit RPR2|nr:ribonuclease P [Candidatus Woesearchaeota archaeon]MDP6265301.1 ribonuclease P [Candidatus Woesearchaeota archaeon]MDP7322475.1 ribonuclease P [Candidatus Woesearchaeota archaeon]MDP7476528.1 ribonuclease P [Candidatus Woesearchaeota archaeon]HJO01656.1 ribonuclease P [Candidatus Woesearchaeota archaeon]|tara:strand:- start:496 stop:807 length:312 start_codon:yes stop_codon:yes gene_type:complete